jgi:hypothetical protein
LICDVGEKPHKIGYPDIECAKKATERLVRRPERPVGRAGHANDVEDFAIRTFAEGGWIVRRKFNEELGALNLIVEGTRFCRRIGREHRSNHVYIVCRLDLGLMMQKCTDPDCRGFQSEPVDIPEEMLEDLRREYAPGQAFSSQRVKVFGLEKVDIASIIAECEREMVCVS